MHFEKDSAAVEAGEHYYADQKFGAPVYADETGAVPGESFATGNTLYARLQRTVGRFGVEQRGIERVPENERTDTNLAKVGTMVSGAESSPCRSTAKLLPQQQQQNLYEQ
jgi:hypothetical protein